MNDADEKSQPRWSRRFWPGGFGAIIVALLGMIVAGSLDASIGSGALYGAQVGFVLGFLLGLDGVEFVMRLWTG